MAEEPNLLFLGVGRVRDCSLLAKCSYLLEDTEVQKIEDVFSRLMAAARVKLGPNQRMRLQWNRGSVAFLMDESGEFLYAVVTANLQYPEKWAYHLLSQFMGEIVSSHGGVMDSTPANALSGPMQDRMNELLQQYQNPEEFDRVASATKNAQKVNQQVNKNVQNVTKNMEQLSDINERSGQLLQHARVYYDDSNSLRSRMWWKARKWYFIGGGILLIVIIILIATSGGGSSDSNNSNNSTPNKDKEEPAKTLKAITNDSSEAIELVELAYKFNVAVDEETVLYLTNL